MCSISEQINNKTEDEFYRESDIVVDDCIEELFNVFVKVFNLSGIQFHDEKDVLSDILHFEIRENMFVNLKGIIEDYKAGK